MSCFAVSILNCDDHGLSLLVVLLLISSKRQRGRGEYTEDPMQGRSLPGYRTALYVHALPQGVQAGETSNLALGLLNILLVTVEMQL